MRATKQAVAKTTQPAVAKKPAKKAIEKPVFNGRRKRNGKSTPEETQQYVEYIDKLIEYLDTLGPRAHDRELKQLSSEDLSFVASFTTYNNHQKGLRLDTGFGGFYVETTKQAVPAKPAVSKSALNGQRKRKDVRTPEERQQFTEHIENLIKRLDTLGPRAQDRALEKLTDEELFYVTWWTTYDNHQKGLRFD